MADDTKPADAAAEEKKPADGESKGEEKKPEEKPASSSSKEGELDLDKELEEEEKHGKPDPDRARDAFNRRQERKPKPDEQEEDQTGEDDKPLTRKDLESIQANAEEGAYRRLQQDQALAMARSLTGSEKEAQLVFAKWRNRQFPASLSLNEQLEEAYAITHRKRLISERNEAMRAAQGKSSASDASPENHRDGPSSGEPGSEHEQLSMKQSGYQWDGAKRMYKKPLGRRGFLYMDPKTKKTFTSPS